jgi:excisionase family DNA binding protein
MSGGKSRGVGNEMIPDGSPKPIAYRPSEAARVLGISLSHLDRMTKAGEIPCARVGRLRLYGDEELRRWVQEKTEETTRSERTK